MYGVYLLLMCSLFQVPGVLGTDISNKLDQVSAQLHSIAAQLIGTETKLNTKMDLMEIQLRKFEAHLTAAEAKLLDIVTCLQGVVCSLPDIVQPVDALGNTLPGLTTGRPSYKQASPTKASPKKASPKKASPKKAFSKKMPTMPVQIPPHIIKQPPTDELLFRVKSRLDENDQPFVIECEAEGEPSPTYRWEKNGKPFNWQVYSNRISEQPGRGTLIITSPRTEDTGQYMCFAENAHGTATSNSVFVRNSFLNNFKEQPPITKTVEEGNPFQLPCEAPDGWPKPNAYWMIQSTNGALKVINSSRLTVDPEGNLWFSNVTRKDGSDEFLYSCSAASFFRNEYKLGNRVFLQVIQSGSSVGLQNKHEPEKQYVTRKNHIAYRGKKVKMWCIFGGTPLPEIRWTKKGGALPQGRTTYESYGKTLVIKHVDIKDEGDYTCEASNGVGIAKSYSINLKVYTSPYFTKEPESQTASEGEDVVFECEAGGYPAPVIKWVHNGKPIGEAPFNPRRTVNPNKIIIRNLTKQDTGNYGCNATATGGYVYKDVFVNVLVN